MAFGEASKSFSAPCHPPFQTPRDHRADELELWHLGVAGPQGGAPEEDSLQTEGVRWHAETVVLSAALSCPRSPGERPGRVWSGGAHTSPWVTEGMA